MDDHAAHAGRSGHVHRLDVLLVHADIADVREGERHDLPRIGGVRQDLLVAGHRGIEADLAVADAWVAEAETLDHRAVRQHQPAGRQRLRPAFAGVRPRLLVLAAHPTSLSIAGTVRT